MCVKVLDYSKGKDDDSSESHEQVLRKNQEALEQFANKLEDFLIDNLPKDINVIIYKDADFRSIELSEEMKTSHFIKVYDGLFYVGLFDPNSGWIQLV